MTEKNDDKPHPKPPKPEDAHPIPIPANDANVGVPLLPPAPGPNPPGTESPNDFIRRRTREIRAADQEKKDDPIDL